MTTLTVIRHNTRIAAFFRRTRTTGIPDNVALTAGRASSHHPEHDPPGSIGHVNPFERATVAETQNAA
jgi:hypothetical protein